MQETGFLQDTLSTIQTRKGEEQWKKDYLLPNP